MLVVILWLEKKREIKESILEVKKRSRRCLRTNLSIFVFSIESEKHLFDGIIAKSLLFSSIFRSGSRIFVHNRNLKFDIFPRIGPFCRQIFISQFSSCYFFLATLTQHKPAIISRNEKRTKTIPMSLLVALRKQSSWWSFIIICFRCSLGLTINSQWYYYIRTTIISFETIITGLLLLLMLMKGKQASKLDPFFSKQLSLFIICSFFFRFFFDQKMNQFFLLETFFFSHSSLRLLSHSSFIFFFGRNFVSKVKTFFFCPVHSYVINLRPFLSPFESSEFHRIFEN